MSKIINLVLFVLLAFNCSVIIWVNQNNNAITQSTLLQEKKQEDGELLLVQVIFRHGIRSPIWYYPGDPYTNYSWPGGFGGLTPHGREQMKRYGQILKKRYRDYLNELSMENVHAQSSPTSRTVDSTLSVLSGLFPFVNSQAAKSQSKQNLSINSQDVIEVTKLSFLTNQTCAEAERMEKLMSEFPCVKKLVFENTEFLSRFSYFTGLDALKDWRIVGGFYDTMLTQMDYFGSEWIKPSWLDKIATDVWQQMEAFQKLEYSRYDGLPEKYFKLKIGSFLKEIISNLNKTINERNVIIKEKLKNEIFLYGTHDTLLTPMLHALGLFTEQPSVGSGLVVELRRVPTTSIPQVYLYYVNGTNGFSFELLQLNQSNTFRNYCPNQYGHCSLDGFVDSLSKFMCDDINLECNNNQ